MDLISKINFFYKQAGLLKYPENMKKTILDYVKSCIEKNKLSGLEEETFGEKFKINVLDLPKHYGPELLQQAANILGGELYVFVYFEEKMTNSDGEEQADEDLGEFKETEMSISIYPNNIRSLEELDETIEHELMHFVQYLLKFKTKSKIKRFNITDFSRSDEFTKAKEYDRMNNLEHLTNKYKIRNKLPIYNDKYLGLPSEFSNKEFNELNKDFESYYEQDPVEFFPLLNDVIKEFKSMKNKDINLFIKGKSGSNNSKNFWNGLKYNKKLYNRAVKELYKAIN